MKYHGQTYPSMKVCCELFNVPVDNVSYYKRTHKCSFEAALDHYVLNESRYSFKFNNQKYPSINACCKEYGLSPDVVYAYKNKNQLTPSAAVRACLAQKQRQENQIDPPKILPKKKKKKSLLRLKLARQTRGLWKLTERHILPYPLFASSII